MKFRVYLPESNSKLPVLYFLSGLTCNYDNFITKSGVIQFASKHKIALVCPDTSPRGCNIKGEAEEWDFGLGAGYYVDSTTDLWKKNYNMYSYVTDELPKLVNSQLPFDEKKQSICGHSMGGHGALVCYLNNPGKYVSCSAFAPICHPSKEGAGWGPKAFTRFLGEDKEAWKKYDSSLLLKSYKGEKVEILCDQGDEDNFLEKLNPQSLIDAAKENEYPLNFRFQKGYDHSYYFISTFIEDHIEFHSKHLNK